MSSKERLMSVLLAPHVSEKSARVAERQNQVVFRVLRDASKPEIKAAVEAVFVLPAEITLSADQQTKLDALKTEYTPKLTAASSISANPAGSKPVPGRAISNMPPKPTRVAIHAIRGTRSPSNGPAAIVTSSGATNRIAVASASGMVRTAVIPAAVQTSSNVARMTCNAGCRVATRPRPWRGPNHTASSRQGRVYRAHTSMGTG